MNDQVTALSGALAAERTKGEVVSAQLDQLRNERREKESIIKQQQVRRSQAYELTCKPI